MRVLMIVLLLSGCAHSPEWSVAWNLGSKFVYAPDLATHGVMDHWSRPVKVGGTLVGDCEDYAREAQIWLAERGIKSTIMMGKWPDSRYQRFSPFEYHAFLVTENDLVLHNMSRTPIPGDSYTIPRNEWTPVDMGRFVE